MANQTNLKDLYNPLVSIVLPTHNRSSLVKKAIQSVLDQTYTNLELIVVDDGSTDDTQVAISKISDSRLIYIYQKKSGRSEARNRAIRVSRGEFIGFLDSDDLFYSNKLELQVKYFKKNPHCKMLYTAANCIDQQGKTLKFKFVAKKSGNLYSQISFMKPLTIALPTVMVRKEIFGEVGLFDSSMDRFEDIDLWRRISKRYRINALNIDTCKILTHEGNHLLSQSPIVILNAIRHYEAKVLKEDREIPAWKKRIGLGRLYFYYGTDIGDVKGWEDVGQSLLKESYKKCYIYKFIYFVHQFKKIVRSNLK